MILLNLLYKLNKNVELDTYKFTSSIKVFYIEINSKIYKLTQYI